MSLASQYACNWLVRWKRAPAAFLSEWLVSVRYYRIWRRSFEGKGKPLDETDPWLAGNVIAFLKSAVRPSHRIFEWGSGASTLFWAKRSESVVTVEHDPIWYERVQELLEAQQITNVYSVCVLPEFGAHGGRPEDPQTFTSHKSEWQGYHFKHYVESIQRFPDAYFDWICVDGRARPSCLIAAMPKLKPGGWLMLDNAGRTHYQPALMHLSAWRRRSVIGPVCRSRNFVETLFLQKPLMGQGTGGGVRL